MAAKNGLIIMPSCSERLIELPCNLTGKGFTTAVVGSDSDTIRLMKGMGVNFPAVSTAKHYYVKVSSACAGCCAEFKVIGKVGDTLNVERVSAMVCECIGTNATVTYIHTSMAVIEDMVRAVGINVVPPLVYDCNTHTLSIDCSLIPTVITPCGT